MPAEGFSWAHRLKICRKYLEVSRKVLKFATEILNQIRFLAKNTLNCEFIGKKFGRYGKSAYLCTGIERYAYRNGTAGSNPWSLIRKEKKTKPGVLHFGLSVVYRRPIQPPLTRWAGGHIATNRLQWSRPQSGFYDYEKALNSKDENRQKACVL